MRMRMRTGESARANQGSQSTCRLRNQGSLGLLGLTPSRVMKLYFVQVELLGIGSKAKEMNLGTRAVVAAVVAAAAATQLFTLMQPQGIARRWLGSAQLS